MPNCEFSIPPLPAPGKATEAGDTYDVRTDPSLEWPCKQTYQIDDRPAQGGSDISGFRLSDMNTDGSVTLTATKDGARAKLTIFRKCTDPETNESVSKHHSVVVGQPEDTSGGILRRLLQVIVLPFIIPWWLLAMLAALAAQLSSLVREGKLDKRRADEIWRKWRSMLPDWVKWVLDT